MNSWRKRFRHLIPELRAAMQAKADAEQKIRDVGKLLPLKNKTVAFRVLLGLCPNCGKNPGDHFYCDECRPYYAKKSKARHQRKDGPVSPQFSQYDNDNH